LGVCGEWVAKIAGLPGISMESAARSADFATGGEIRVGPGFCSAESVVGSADEDNEGVSSGRVIG